MKNLLIVLSLLIPCLVMSQTNKTLKSGEVDKRVSFRMDSLSKNDKLFKEEIFD